MFPRLYWVALMIMRRPDEEHVDLAFDIIANAPTQTPQEWTRLKNSLMMMIEMYERWHDGLLRTYAEDLSV